MPIGNKQIGWSNESNLLWDISNQLDRLTKVIAAGGGISGAENGLSINNNNVQLGGDLIQETTVSLNDNTFVISGDNGSNITLSNSSWGMAFNYNEDNGTYLYFQSTGESILGGYNYGDGEVGCTLFININGEGICKINNTFTSVNDEFSNTISYDSYLADTTKTQLEHINNFFFEGSYFPIIARFVINGNPNIQGGVGIYNFLIVPVFASNATALAGGLVAGDIYRVTGTGNLNIVF